jgi:opacity protein-like surface antigen
MYLSFGEASYGQARFVPFAIGARYSPAAGDGRRGGPYVELSPALVWSRWKVHFYDVDQETAIRFGLIAGLGVHGKVANGVGIDIGLRYFLSGNGETRYAGPSDSQSLDGLDHAGLHFGLSYSL